MEGRGRVLIKDHIITLLLIPYLSQGQVDDCESCGEGVGIIPGDGFVDGGVTCQCSKVR